VKRTKTGQGTKAESRGGATSKPPKVGCGVASLMGLRAVLKTELPHLAGGAADHTELQL
jgi:hypothetical protein